MNAPPAEQAQALASFLEIRVDGGKAALSGVVPDGASKNRLLARARAVYGKTGVIDGIRVDSSATDAAWVKNAASILASTRRRAIGEARIVVAQDAVTVRGSVPNEAARKKILAGVASAAGPLKVVDELVVAAPAAAAKADAGTAPAVKAAATAPAAPAGRAGELEANLRGLAARFAFDSAEISPQAAGLLDRVAGIIRDRPDVPVEVAGHSCSLGERDYNLDLSRRRADNARRYLIDRGVRADRLTAAGYGEERPAADNATREGRQKNRRTEFHVKKGE